MFRGFIFLLRLLSNSLLFILSFARVSAFAPFLYLSDHEKTIFIHGLQKAVPRHLIAILNIIYMLQVKLDFRLNFF